MRLVIISITRDIVLLMNFFNENIQNHNLLGNSIYTTYFDQNHYKTRTQNNNNKTRSMATANNQLTRM